MLINVFRIIRKSQVGEFDQGWSLTLQESGSREPDLSITVLQDQMLVSGAQDLYILATASKEITMSL